MSSDIKERLRVADVGEAFIGQHGVELVQTELGLEAADRIEALEAEVARLRAALEIIAGDSNDASWSAELAHKTLKALEGSE